MGARTKSGARPSAITADMCATHSRAVPSIDDPAERVLSKLRESPTDLPKLVVRVSQGRRGVVGISAQAIERWNKDDADSWELVREWLARRAVSVIVL
jgi:hypothetical protein